MNNLANKKKSELPFQIEMISFLKEIYEVNKGKNVIKLTEFTANHV